MSRYKKRFGRLFSQGYGDRESGILIEDDDCNMGQIVRAKIERAITSRKQLQIESRK